MAMHIVDYVARTEKLKLANFTPKHMHMFLKSYRFSYNELSVLFNSIDDTTQSPSEQDVIDYCEKQEDLDVMYRHFDDLVARNALEHKLSSADLLEELKRILAGNTFEKYNKDLVLDGSLEKGLLQYLIKKSMRLELYRTSILNGLFVLQVNLAPYRYNKLFRSEISTLDRLFVHMGDEMKEEKEEVMRHLTELCQFFECISLDYELRNLLR